MSSLTTGICGSLNGVPVTNKFVDRPAQMESLEKCLLPRTENERRTVLILHGLGGIGKTQLSAEFVRRHCHEYSSVFWLDGRTENSLKQGIATIANRIPEGQISEKSRSYNGSNAQVGAVVKEVLQWLSTEGNHSWLLVFDDVYRDDHAMGKGVEEYNIESYFPRANHGYILITTHLHWLGKYGCTVKLNAFDAYQAQTLLTEKIGRPFKGM